MVSHRSFSHHFLPRKTDLFTGALSYENKFSLDAKPISGGVRFLRASDLLVFVESRFFTRVVRSFEDSSSSEERDRRIERFLLGSRKP